MEDRISRFFPSVPQDKAGITLHHLLTHSAGLEAEHGPSDYEPVGREEKIKRILTAPLKWPPGQRYFYSNSGFSMLGAIIEIVTGQSYERYLREQLFLPAGMTKTGYLLPRFQPEQLAQGYEGGRRWGTILERPMAPDGPYWNLRANGAIHSTCGDMYKWRLALEGNAVLSEEARQKFQHPHIPEGPGADSFYGYGWAIFNSPRGRLIAHNGGNGIFSADFRRYTEAGLVLFVAANLSEWKAFQVSPPLARLGLGLETALPPKVTRVEPVKLAEFAGAYTLPSGARIMIAARDGKLLAWAAGQEAFSLLASGTRGDLGRAEALNRRTAALLESSAKGEYAALHQAFGKRMPLERLAQMEAERWQERKARFGALRRVEVLGTAPGQEEDSLTVARLEFERGSELLQFIWAPRELLGIRLVMTPPEKVFLPRSPAEFVSFDLASGASVALRFDRSPDRVVTGLIFLTSSGDISARRAR